MYWEDGTVKNGSGRIEVMDGELTAQYIYVQLTDLGSALKDSKNPRSQEFEKPRICNSLPSAPFF